ncbi:hypothetical protein GGR57DRAFT_470559 [Xylariaceae sp. FL1272]|nr:hypothetical protein GGR57DRAFT_470559 [Xylariaceae sp. FL1272]
MAQKAKFNTVLVFVDQNFDKSYIYTMPTDPKILLPLMDMRPGETTASFVERVVRQAKRQENGHVLVSRGPCDNGAWDYEHFAGQGLTCVWLQPGMYERHCRLQRIISRGESLDSNKYPDLLDWQPQFSNMRFDTHVRDTKTRVEGLGFHVIEHSEGQNILRKLTQLSEELGLSNQAISSGNTSQEGNRNKSGAVNSLIQTPSAKLSLSKPPGRWNILSWLRSPLPTVLGGSTGKNVDADSTSDRALN